MTSPQNNQGWIEEGYESLPGNGIRWREYNPQTAVRVTYTLRDNVVTRDTEYLNTGFMLDHNAEIANNKQGTRWGNGQVYGRVPMNIAYHGYLGDATKAGDDKSVAKWFNDSDNRKWRTFGGQL